MGASEVACRLAIDSASFGRAAGNLQRVGLPIGDESLRKLVENEGKLLLAAQRTEQLELDFAASDCQTTATPDPKPVARIYVGSDGVMVPVVTESEKLKRRDKAKERRKRLPRRRGHQRKPLAAMKPSARRGPTRSSRSSRFTIRTRSIATYGRRVETAKPPAS